MLIGGTILTPHARTRVKKFRSARTAGAGVRNTFSSYLSENIQLHYCPVISQINTMSYDHAVFDVACPELKKADLLGFFRES